MKDPYQILGVAPSATDEEIKNAYRELARKYHPDNYVNSPLSDLAEEKMKEVNEAYEQIKQMRAKGKSSSQNYRSTSSDPRYTEVRQLINAKEFARADMILEGILQSERNAEWYFLKGCTLLRRGWYYDAQKHFQQAANMDPSNPEYRAALEQIQRSSMGYGNQRPPRNGVTGCGLCGDLICADCLCELCGGDLIPCM
jgi:curved DNA-binding protein CbpA